MSKKSGKLDLLVRVRYQNPLPPPPYPPKLLTIQTDINRLGEPSYLNHLAASTPLPMLVDSEMGMPLNLNEYDGIWEGQEDSLNPRPDAGRVMHPTDLALLAPLSSSAASAANGAQSRDIKLKLEDLATLRTSAHTKKKASGRRRSTYGDIARANQDVDASETAQIMAIDTTFFDMTSTDLSAFKHPDPKKRHLKVVDSYDILPDDESYANGYLVVKYPERPSAATAAVSRLRLQQIVTELKKQNPGAVPSSPRLRRAFLRPTEDAEGTKLLDYFLPEEEDVARVDTVLNAPFTYERYEELKANGQIDDDEQLGDNVHYERIRTYEMASVQDANDKEILLSIIEGDANEDGDARPTKKRKGAYITPIDSKVLLRKMRAKRRGEEETREDIWDRVRLACRERGEGELEFARQGKASLVDTNWISEQQRKLQGGDDQIVGDGEAIDEDEPLGAGEDE